MSEMGDSDRSRERSRRDRPSRFSEASRDRSSDRGRGDHGSSKASKNRVYVSNIPYEYRWQDMKDLFRSQVGDVQFVELFVDDNDKPKGCGIIEFADSSCVKKCLELMQRYEVKGRKLVVREDTGNKRDKHGNIEGGGSSNKRSRDDRYRDDRDRYDSHHGSGGISGGIGGGGGGVGGGVGGGGNGNVGGALQLLQDDKWGNTYGLSPNFLESLNIDAPLSNRVFVANLEYNIDKKKLKEVFRIAGKVQKVEIPLDKDGRSRGFAVIEYDHPVEAVQSISMLHNQFLYDRPMTVRMDRANDGLKLPEGLKTVGMGLGTNGEPLRNVAHNIPSINSNSNNNQSGGAGILGAVPNSALQVASALSGLNNVVGGQFGSLSSLAGNLLGNGALTGADLSLASSLVQNQNHLAALTGNNASSNVQPNLSSNTNNQSNLSSFGRMGETNFSSGPLSNFGSNQQGYSSNTNNNNNSSSRTYTNTFDVQKSTPNTGNYGSFNNENSGYNSNMNSSMIRSSPGQNDLNKPANKSGFSRKVIISNLPPSVSYQTVYDKVAELGEVKFLEEKDRDSMVVMYGSEWQAQRASLNLDRTCIDGRFVDARLYYG